MLGGVGGFIYRGGDYCLHICSLRKKFFSGNIQSPRSGWRLRPSSSARSGLANLLPDGPKYQTIAYFGFPD